MLEKLIKLYTAYMLQDVRSPTPHLAGPPGVGKSAVVQQLAELLGVTLHIVNVSRLSPLELEGVQMPVGTMNDPKDKYRLHLLTSTLWTQLKEGDIVLFDEFMRGFPEVYNGLLDIMTSRQVAGHHLPKVFFIGASNSVAAYDGALEDRLLHLPVADLRTNGKAKGEAKKMFLDELGLHPDLYITAELDAVFTTEILPTYEVLDQFKNKAALGSTMIKGQSARKLVGQVKLREIQSLALQDLISYNNQIAMKDGKVQYIVLTSGSSVPNGYMRRAEQIRGNHKLTKIQAENLEMNLQLIQMYEATREPLTEDEPQGDEYVEFA